MPPDPGVLRRPEALQRLPQDGRRRRLRLRLAHLHHRRQCLGEGEGMRRAMNGQNDLQRWGGRSRSDGQAASKQADRQSDVAAALARAAAAPQAYTALGAYMQRLLEQLLLVLARAVHSLQRKAHCGLGVGLEPPADGPAAVMGTGKRSSMSDKEAASGERSVRWPRPGRYVPCRAQGIQKQSRFFLPSCSSTHSTRRTRLPPGPAG